MLLRVRFQNVQIFPERDKVLGHETLISLDQKVQRTLRCLRPLNDFALRLAESTSASGGQSRQAKCCQL